jgi:hypothetical protein
MSILKLAVACLQFAVFLEGHAKANCQLKTANYKKAYIEKSGV